MSWLAPLLALIQALVADRTRLALENAALRQQIIVQKRSAKRAKIEGSDRIFWILMRRMLHTWCDTLIPVEPESVGCALLTLNGIARALDTTGIASRNAESQGEPIDPEIIELIKRMSEDQVMWGGPRIRFRASPAQPRDRRIYRCQLHSPPQVGPIANLAHVPRQPHVGSRLRLLRRSVTECRAPITSSLLANAISSGLF